METVIADALTSELGAEHRLAATVAAASLMAAMEVVEDTAAGQGGTLSAAEIERMLDDAVRFAEAGVSALQRA
jgi:hypothetical protein